VTVCPLRGLQQTLPRSGERMTHLASQPADAGDAPHSGHAPAASDPPVARGDLLRQARLKRGLTLEQISGSTKIPLRHLTALEDGAFLALPPDIYRRAEVRAYADAVGLDRAVALAWLEGAMNEAMPDRAPQVPPAVVLPDSALSVRPGVLVTAAVAAVAALTAFAIWVRQPDAGDLAAPPVDPVATSGDTAGGGAQQAAPAALPPVPSQPVTALGDDAPTAARAEPPLRVVTVPAGARVTVDGVGWGVTPLAIRYLAPGAKLVRVTLDGYEAEERAILVDPDGQATRLRIAMRRAKDGD